MKTQVVVVESYFSKAAICCKPTTLYKNGTSLQVFSCKFSDNFQITFPQNTAERLL